MADNGLMATAPPVVKGAPTPSLLKPKPSKPKPPPPKPRRECHAPGCGKESRLEMCTGCRTVAYCSDACEAADSERHKPECRKAKMNRWD